MNLLILNGNPSGGDPALDAYVSDLAAKAREGGHGAEVLVLREMKIRPCNGCFNCWLKTPGTCSLRDDEIEVSRRYLASDHVIVASPLIMGFLSAISKHALDRNIPLVHAHLEEVGGEVHHRKRYDEVPTVSFLLQRGPDTDDEDVSIASAILERAAINMRTTLRFVRFVDTPVREVLHALDVH